MQITRFDGPEVLDVVDLPDPVPGEGQERYEVSSSGISYADTHYRLSRDRPERRHHGRPRLPVEWKESGSRHG